MEASPTAAKWVQIAPAASVTIRSVLLHPSQPGYNQIGDGFGFPVRFKLEASDDPEFKSGTAVITDHTGEDFPNPGISPVVFETSLRARHLRVTATTLASRKDGYMFALAELEAEDAAGQNTARKAAVSSLDSIEAPGAWARTYLNDGAFPGAALAGRPAAPEARASLNQARQLVIQAMIGEEKAAALAAAEKELAEVESAVRSLPPARLVFAGTIHHGSGAFTGTGPSGGKPRPVSVLARGDVRRPIRPATPGTLSIMTTVPGLPARFDLPADAREGARRAALAQWLNDPKNGLTWCTIVNRLWQ